MHELSEMERTVKNGLLQLEAPWDAAADARVLDAALAAVRVAKPRPALRSGIARWAAAAACAVVLVVTIAHRTARPVWALEPVIEAMGKYKACNLTMIDQTGVAYDLWAKAEPSGALSGEVTMRGGNGSAIWVREGRTYYYDPRSSTVEVDDAKTAGFSPWLGPELMKMIAKANDARTAYATDPATGRDLVVMTGNLATAAGPISWSIEFDKESKLPVAFKQWANLKRSGAPALSILRIVYYQEAPKGALTVDVPANAIYVPKPIILPEANLALLDRNPNQGVPADGLTREQAAREILERVYGAAIEGDLPAIRRLCPLTASWSDELLRMVILHEEEGKRVAAVVSIGAIVREGSNRLGTFVVAPVRLRSRDGRLWDEKQIVQFRSTGGRESCVVYGPYGMLSEVK